MWQQRRIKTMFVAESLRAFKENMKLGRFKDIDPEEQKRKDAERQQKERDEEEKARSIQVGNRWELISAGEINSSSRVWYNWS